MSKKQIARIFKAPSDSFFLFGCRGTGKSTLLKELFPAARWYDLLDEAVYQRLLASPSIFGMELQAMPAGSWVVIDEIQRLPSLLNEVHRAIEKPGLTFVLCGSSARKLKRAGVNLLGGRALLRRLHPFLPEELGSAFDLEAALAWGTLPLVWSSTDRRERLTAYTQLYLKEEIQAEALVRNLPGFARFLPIAALFHGQVVNVSNIAREAGVARTTVNGYLDIIEETMLAFKLPAFEARLRLRERKLPKLYWTDPGIVRAVKHRLGEVEPEERGSLFEGLVAQLLRASIDYHGLCDSWHYWAPAQSRSVGVDFLLQKAGALVAVEAKSGARFAQEWCKGLRAVAGLKGLARRIVVFPDGAPMATDDGIEVLPFARFARIVADGTLFPP